MAIKHGRIVTHFDELPFINSYNPLNVFSWEAMGEVKDIISPPSNAYSHRTYHPSDKTQQDPTLKFGRK